MTSFYRSMVQTQRQQLTILLRKFGNSVEQFPNTFALFSALIRRDRLLLFATVVVWQNPLCFLLFMILKIIDRKSC